MRGSMGSTVLSCVLFLAGTPLFAAVTGTVTNLTTGKPQAGATVALYQLATATGLSLIDQAKSDAQGNFTINQNPQGPHLIRTAFDGVTQDRCISAAVPRAGDYVICFVPDTQTEQGLSASEIQFTPARIDVRPVCQEIMVPVG